MAVVAHDEAYEGCQEHAAGKSVALFRQTENGVALIPKLDDCLRIKGAAKYLGVCRNTLRNWGRTGKIPEYRHPVNNYRLFKVSDLDKLLHRTDESVKRTTRHRRPSRPR